MSIASIDHMSAKQIVEHLSRVGELTNVLNEAAAMYGFTLVIDEDVATRLNAKSAPSVVSDALALAIQFHETYERLAPSFGYETRTETRQFDPTTPNGRLMVAVCGELSQPKGMVLVPVAPTEAMLVAARDWSYGKYGKPIGHEDARGCYAAMIAAVRYAE
jgi:hypothetical protein